MARVAWIVHRALSFDDIGSSPANYDDGKYPKRQAKHSEPTHNTTNNGTYWWAGFLLLRSALKYITIVCDPTVSLYRYAGLT